jgi:hypothetical protein
MNMKESVQMGESHSGETGNEESNTLAKSGVEKEDLDDFSPEIPAHFNVQGVGLANEAIAYRGI